MQTHELVPHIACPPDGVRAVTVHVRTRDADWLWVRWRVDGSAGLVLPPFAGAGRADRLWESTCFELFVRPPGGAGYSEFNFSPSDRWNAYDFDGYRDGMRERAMPRAPVCTMRPGSHFALFEAAIPTAGLPEGCRHADCAIGLSAVIEEAGGTKSYWALAQPYGHRPDFHHSACFAAHLAAGRAG